MAPVSKPTENPYVGLRVFEEKDAGFFIGREEATRSFLDKLQPHPIVFVSGPPGSGRTSMRETNCWRHPAANAVERFPNMALLDPASVRGHGFRFRGPLNLAGSSAIDGAR